MNTKHITKVISDFNMDDWESKSYAVPFHLGYFLGCVNYSEHSKKHKPIRESLDLECTYDLMRKSFAVLEIDFDLFEEFDRGIMTSGKDVGSYYPSGIMELCFLLRQAILNAYQVELTFFLLGKSISYLVKEDISQSEFQFFVNRIPKNIIIESADLLEKLCKKYLIGEKRKNVLKVMFFTAKIDRNLTSFLVNFPEYKDFKSTE